MKKLNNKGFTLAELLIVVAIISVLVAIMFPVFGSSMTKAKLATDLANVRSKYAELVTEEMTNTDFNGTVTIDGTKLSDVTLPANGGNNSTVTFNATDHKIELSLGDLSDGFAIDSDVTVNPAPAAPSSN